MTSISSWYFAGIFAGFEQRTGIRAELHAPGGGHYFPDPVQTAAYRIVEEALTNIERHAGVESGLYEHRRGDRPDRNDPGCRRRVDQATIEPGRGLGSMREWAELLGGTLDIRAATGEGVTVTATLPVSAPDV